MPVLDEPITLPFLLDTRETALLLNLQPETLEKMRTQGRGPEYLKLGNNGPRATVRYTLESVWKFVLASVPEPESE